MCMCGVCVSECVRVCVFIAHIHTGKPGKDIVCKGGKSGSAVCTGGVESGMWF